jgi:lysophospholipase L1-like esterase
VLFVAAYFVDALPAAVSRSLGAMNSARHHLGEGLPEARRRVLKAAYADGIARIQEALPRNATYILVQAGTNDAHHWVRYDLLPRRPVWGGVPGQEAPEPWVFSLPPDTPVVLCSTPEEAPTLTRWDEFRQQLEKRP